MGFVQNSIVVANGANLAIAGLKPSGIAAQGQVIWRAQAPVANINRSASPNGASAGYRLVGPSTLAPTWSLVTVSAYAIYPGTSAVMLSFKPA